MKKSITTPILSLIVAILVVLFFFTWITNRPSKEVVITEEKIALSSDKKSITSDDVAILSIENDVIFNWFKTESQLCDGSNIDSNPGRKSFCEDEVTFKNMTRFKSIVGAPDNTVVGFTIESDTLTPDTVVGVFYPHENRKVTMLSSYYLGNEFLSFSPSGKYFVYTSSCFEGNCVLYVKDSLMLLDRINFAPREEDIRRKYEFVRWISDNEIEFTLNGELQKSFLDIK
jgi:hypothetical protein